VQTVWTYRTLRTVQERTYRTVPYCTVPYRYGWHGGLRAWWFRTTVPYRTVPVPYRTVWYQVPYRNVWAPYGKVPVPYRTVTAQRRIRTSTVISWQFEPAIQTTAVRKRSFRLVDKSSGTALLNSCLIIILPGAFVPHLCDEPCGSVGLRPGVITT
jgi:hypothetical protein